MDDLNVNTINLQPDFNPKPRLTFNKKGVLLASFFLLPLGVGILYIAYTWTQDLWVRNEPPAAHGALLFPKVDDRRDEKDYVMPAKENNRYDVLILGVRGKDDPDGGSLTDTIMLFSLDRTTNKSTLVSIPRDLYVRLGDRKDKLNAAYEYLGLKGTEKLVSKITGVYIDNSVVFDFSSFKKIVDDIGGIDIVLDKPFEETTQWGYVFKLPAGLNHLDGETALYYVRSRYSSSDFDRAQRQQQIMFAIKNKMTQLDFISNPAHSLALLTELKSNIQTDIDIFDIKSLIQLAQQVEAGKIKRYVLTTLDYLYEARSEAGAYILLPQGDNFDRLKSFFKTVLVGGTSS